MTTSALFEGLPAAPTPPPPDAPGGSGGKYDTATWKPETITRYELRAVDDTTVFGYVTLQFAAELFDVQRERLQVACWRGSLPGKLVSGVGTTGKGQWFVHPGDVARYLATTLRGVTTRRKADELSPKRAERERQRLQASAAAAEARAQAVREKLAKLGPAPTPEARGDLTLRLNRQEMNARNRARVAKGLERQQRALADAAAQREAWIRESGVDPELIDEIDELAKR